MLKNALLRRLALACGCLGLSSLLQAQTADILTNHDVYHYVDRLDILGRVPDHVPTDIKPYSRAKVSEIFAAAADSIPASEQKWFNLARSLGDDEYALQQAGKGVFKTFYKNKRDLYAIRTENLDLFVNPIAFVGSGITQSDYVVTDPNTLLWRNTRGLQARGSLFGKVGFYTEATDNQARYQQFIQNSFNQYDVLDGQGYVKPFKGNGFDFLQARGYVTYSPVKQFRIKLGRDRAFFGQGYQSLHLSDYSADYFFLNLQTRIWKLEYTNHFTQLVDYVAGKPDNFGTFPKKHAVFHQLSYRPSKGVSISLFESVVYSPSQPNGHRGVELEYLNPIILYRTVEQFVGSPDNSALGISAKVNFLKRFQGYGQIMLDDFNFGVRDQGSGYWGNKFGYQAGLKYMNAFFIPRLDLQVEYNRIRPYTYSHFNPSASYSHYGQFLAHGMGANLTDLNLIARYQPLPRLNLMAVLSRVNKGTDPASGVNYGGDIFRSYSLFRPADFGNVVGQGEQLQVTSFMGKASWQLLGMDCFLDLEGRYHKVNTNSEMSVLGAVRWNIPYRPVKY
jgi:hypothetical protein